MIFIRINSIISLFLIATFLFSSLGSCVGYDYSYTTSLYKNFEKEDKIGISWVTGETLTSTMDRQPWLLKNVGLDKELKIAEPQKYTKLHFKKNTSSNVKVKNTEKNNTKQTIATDKTTKSHNEKDLAKDKPLKDDDEKGLAKDKTTKSNSGKDLAKDKTTKSNSGKDLAKDKTTKSNSEKDLAKDEQDYIEKLANDELGIINCASEPVAKAVGINKSDAALQLLAVDIKLGNFDKNKRKDGKLYTSALSLVIVLNSHGKKVNGYSVNMEDFTKTLKEGDTAILYVNGDHYIAVNKNKDGNFDVIDSNKNNGKAKTYSEYELQNLLNGVDAASTNGSKTTGYSNVTDEEGKIKVITDAKNLEEAKVLADSDLKEIKGAAYVTGQVKTPYIVNETIQISVAVKVGSQWYEYRYNVTIKRVYDKYVSGTVWENENNVLRNAKEASAARSQYNLARAQLELEAAIYNETAEKKAFADAKAGKGVIRKTKITASRATELNNIVNKHISSGLSGNSTYAKDELNNAMNDYANRANDLYQYAQNTPGQPAASNNYSPSAVNTAVNQAQQVIQKYQNGGSSGGGTGNNGGSGGGNQASGPPTVTVKKGVMYNVNGKAFGIWDGKNAYVLNKGQLVKSAKWTQITKDKYKNLSLSKVDPKVSTKVISFIKNVADGKVVNSGVYSLSRVITNTNRGTLAFRAIATDLTTNNFNAKKFSGKNALISTNALKTVLNNYSSKKYIARTSVTPSGLEEASKNGKTIVRLKDKNKKWQYIAISKATSNKVTIYDNKKSKKIATKDIKSYLNKTYKFTSGVAITFNSKVGKAVSVSSLKKATGI